MSYFGRNIKKIRTIRKLSQTAFAKLFHLSRAAIGAYEEGRAEAKIDTVIEIANYFSLSIDQLLTKQLTVNEIIRYNEYHTSENRILEGVLYLDRKSQPLYCQTVKSNKFDIAQYTKAFLPWIDSSNHILIEVCSNEMNIEGIGINIGNIIIGKKTLLEDLVLGNIYCIVSRKKIIIRRLSVISNTIELIADNKYYENIIMEIPDIIEIWKMNGIFSNSCNKSMIFDKFNNLEKKIENLNNNISIIKKNMLFSGKDL